MSFSYSLFFLLLLLLLKVLVYDGPSYALRDVQMVLGYGRTLRVMNANACCMAHVG